MAISGHASTVTKILKLLINIVCLILYRKGDEGYFMGATLNRNQDAEVLTAGVYIGFLIYNIVSIISGIFDAKSCQLSIAETLMNFVGAILWLTAGGIISLFWFRFTPGNQFIQNDPSTAGMAMGVLTIINAWVYLVETFLTYSNCKSLNGCSIG